MIKFNLFKIHKPQFHYSVIINFVIFTEIALALVIAAAFGFIAHILKQPAIIGFIAAGIAAGIFGFENLGKPEIIESLSSIGVALLLFMVGLEMRFDDLKHVGVASLLTGLGQIIFTCSIGFGILHFLGFALVPALYIAIALTFSSTIIIIKLLSEKGDLQSLYGRIVVGFLLVQDFVAVLILVFLAGIQSSGNPALSFGLVLIKGAIMVIATIAISKIFPKILHLIGTSQEMLFLFSIAWSLGIAAVVASPAIGLSIEIGGFLAGLSLASSSEHFQISSRLRPIRDFFIIIFFIGLGLKMMEGIGSVDVGKAALLSLFVLIGNPLVVMFIMGGMGYRPRTSFLSSLTVAQISEFSLIVMALGYRLGHIGGPEVALVTLIGIFTIFCSSYLIIYSEKIYLVLKPFLSFFEFRKKKKKEEEYKDGWKDHIILIGAHRLGQNILASLTEGNKKFLVIDFDPKIVKDLSQDGISVMYGDASDEDVREAAGFAKAKAVVAAVPNFHDNAVILKETKTINPKARVINTASDEWHAERLYEMGSDYVILPHYLGGEHLGNILRNKSWARMLDSLKERSVSAFKNTST
jgi:Kef-type K+ transport system membrane component KefB